jgi:hypothetical protein
VSIISNEWLEESELSSDAIHLGSPSTTIHCQIHRDPFEARYNPVVGVNIMSASFAHDFIKTHAINPNNKTFEKPFKTHCPKFGNFICAPYPGKTHHGSLVFLYL